MIDDDDVVHDPRLVELTHDLDTLIRSYPMEPHCMAGVLLSRVTLLMVNDPATAKELVRYIWEQFDLIETEGPGAVFKPPKET